MMRNANNVVYFPLHIYMLVQLVGGLVVDVLN